jgi:hypothetical protein
MRIFSYFFISYFSCLCVIRNPVTAGIMNDEKAGVPRTAYLVSKSWAYTSCIYINHVYTNMFAGDCALAFRKVEVYY